MRDVPVVEIEKVRCAVVRFEHGQILLPELAVPGITRMEGEEKGKIGVVGVEQVEVAEVKGVVSRNRSEKGVEQVVAFFIELRIMHAEDFVELRGCSFDRGEIAVVEDHGQRKESEVVAMK